MSEKYSIQRMVVGADAVTEERRMFRNCCDQRWRDGIVSVQSCEELFELDVVGPGSVSGERAKCIMTNLLLLQRQLRKVRHDQLAVPAVSLRREEQSCVM